MNAAVVEAYLRALQDKICETLETIDGSATFAKESWDRPEGGGGISRVLAEGDVIEKGGVNFSHVVGAGMPCSLTQHRPEPRWSQPRNGGVPGHSSTQSPRPDVTRECSPVHGREARRGSGLVDGRRVRSHSLLRLRGRRCPLASDCKGGL